MLRSGFVVSPCSVLLLLSLVGCDPAVEPISAMPGVSGGSGGQMGGAPVVAGAGKAGSGGVGGTASVASVDTGGSGGAGGSVPSDRGPTAATNGVNFPFPQNRQSSHCSYPMYRNADVRAAFDWWKSNMVTSDGANGHLRVKRMPTDSMLEMGSTVSEGIGYGMLIAVYMNDQMLFDELWKYEQQWLSKFGLMDWYISGDGSKRLGEGAASDADEDMAYALLMADRQWGGNGTLGDSYFNVAKDQIQKMWDHEVHEGKLLKPGDSWDIQDPWTLVNVSYFAPSYYRAFAAASGNMGWNDVISTSYDTIAASLNDQNKNTSNGLVPAWSTSQGAPTGAAFDNAPTNYQYDSCRTPFRVGIDYCINGESRAQSYVAKTSQFFSGIGASGIVDGYGLDGTPQAQNSSGQSAAFIGPATVGAMSAPAYTSLLEQGYTLLQQGYADAAPKSLLVGGEYYDGSWTVLSLLMLSGNFLDYTQEQPFKP